MVDNSWISTTYINKKYNPFKSPVILRLNFAIQWHWMSHRILWLSDFEWAIVFWIRAKLLYSSSMLHLILSKKKQKWKQNKTKNKQTKISNI